MEPPDVLVTGETLVDMLPDRPGRLAEVESFCRRAGGAPANVAVALARLGRPPYFLTRLSTDGFGDFLARTLAEHGVPDRFVSRDPDRRTALAFVTHGEDADRGFAFYRDGTADLHVDSDAVPDSAFEAVEVVYVGGPMLAVEPARSATLEVVERARAHGCTVAFDPNSRPELWPSPGEFREVLDATLPRVDLVKATPDDFAGTRFAGEDHAALAERVAAAGPHTVFVTLGAAGAYVHATADAPWGPAGARHEGYAIEPVDATGAGDAFLAGVLAALAEDEPLAEALAFANAVAALTTTAAGAMAALPDREAVAAFRAERA